MFGISLGSLLVILAIVLLLFGTKKLKNMGRDMGAAIKGFKQAVREGEESAKPVQSREAAGMTEGRVRKEPKDDV